jgi:flagellar basal body-associated protein FliL
MRIAIIVLVIALAALALAGFATFAALGMKSPNGRQAPQRRCGVVYFI